MNGIAQFFLVGNLAADPELKQTATGQDMARLSVAVGRSFRQNEQWKSVTSYFRITCWGFAAKSAAKFAAKGKPIAVSGTMQINKWQDRDGKTQYDTQLVADKMVIGKGADRADDEVSESDFRGAVEDMMEGGYDDPPIPF